MWGRARRTARSNAPPSSPAGRQPKSKHTTKQQQAHNNANNKTRPQSQTKVFGELALKALEFVQTGLPMAGLAVAGAQFRLNAEDRRLLWQVRLGWRTAWKRRCQAWGDRGRGEG